MRPVIWVILFALLWYHVFLAFIVNICWAFVILKIAPDTMWPGVYCYLPEIDCQLLLENEEFLWLSKLYMLKLHNDKIILSGFHAQEEVTPKKQPIPLVKDLSGGSQCSMIKKIHYFIIKILKDRFYVYMCHLLSPDGSSPRCSYVQLVVFCFLESSLGPYLMSSLFIGVLLNSYDFTQ